jgi:hypothetical protein
MVRKLTSKALRTARSTATAAEARSRACVSAPTASNARSPESSARTARVPDPAARAAAKRTIAVRAPALANPTAAAAHPKAKTATASSLRTRSATPARTSRPTAGGRGRRHCRSAPQGAPTPPSTLPSHPSERRRAQLSLACVVEGGDSQNSQIVTHTAHGHVLTPRGGRHQVTRVRRRLGPSPAVASGCDRRRTAPPPPRWR